MSKYFKESLGWVQVKKTNKTDQGMKMEIE